MTCSKRTVVYCIVIFFVFQQLGCVPNGKKMNNNSGNGDRLEMKFDLSLNKKLESVTFSVEGDLQFKSQEQRPKTLAIILAVLRICFCWRPLVFLASLGLGLWLGSRLRGGVNPSGEESKKSREQLENGDRTRHLVRERLISDRSLVGSDQQPSQERENENSEIQNNRSEQRSELTHSDDEASLPNGDGARGSEAGDQYNKGFKLDPDFNPC